MSSNQDPNTVLLLVDLDGTITRSVLNNTYTFVRMFLKFRRDPRAVVMHALFSVLSVIGRLLTVMRLTRVISLDALLITTLFFGIRREELKRFAYSWFLTLLRLGLINSPILAYINKLPEGYSKQGLSVRRILLTACTEEPACTIAKLLKFDYCIARGFHELRHVIVSVKDREDIPFFKYRKLSRYLEQHEPNVVKALYITDIYSLKAEIPFVSSGMLDFVIILAKEGNDAISAIRLSS